MTLVEFHEILFSGLSQTKHQDLALRLADKNMVIYELLKSCFSTDINISIHKNKNEYFYRISPDKECDFSYIQSCYNDISVSLYAHNYSVNVWMDGRDICIRLNDQ